MKKQLFLLLVLFCGAFVTAQAQDVFEIYCGESITLQPDGGVLGTNASWKWYSGSCGSSLLYAGTSYTVSPKSSTTYYVRAEGSCGTTTCRSVVVTIKPPVLTIIRGATDATEGVVMTFTANGYPSGGTLTWSNAVSIGGNSATATMQQAAATNTVSPYSNCYLAYATYTIAAGNSCRATNSNYAVYQATCPYSGTDLMAGSCYKDGEAANNWRARVQDTRVSGMAEINTTEGRKYYNIVQMPDGKWWMAQNLDYRKGLTWYANADSPTTVYTSDLYKGMYWCPGTHSSRTVSNITTKAGCNTYGALYPKLTTMSVNGTGVTANNTSTNPSGVQGVCPTGWHVPSDTEWGIVMDCVEGNCDAQLHNSPAYGTEIGIYVSRRLRDRRACVGDNPQCGTVEDSKWNYGNGLKGSDDYGFGALPAGARSSWENCQIIHSVGSFAWWDSAGATSRYIGANYFGEYQWNSGGSTGYSIRCVK